MEEYSELKRPWTIKLFVWIVLSIVTWNLIRYIFFGKEGGGVGFLLLIVSFISLIGIWQGRIWARNLFFILTLPITFLFVLASGATVIQIENSENYIQEFYLALAMLIIPIFLAMIFTKSSREWFTAMNKEKLERKTTYDLSWQFQLMIVVVSIVLGFLTMLMSTHFNFFSLLKELRQLYHPMFWGGLFMLLLFVNLSVLLGAMIVQMPFWVMLGIWKKKYRILLWRLIVIGSFFPLYMQYFVMGHDRNNIGPLLAIFGTNMIVFGMVSYLGLLLGEKVTEYYIKLNDIKKEIDKQ